MNAGLANCPLVQQSQLCPSGWKHFSGCLGVVGPADSQGPARPLSILPKRTVPALENWPLHCSPQSLRTGLQSFFPLNP